MSRRHFDRFMVAADNGRNPKLARLTDAEFRALVQGVWPIASGATPRGAFMIGKSPATAEDVAFLAPKVSKRTAASCIAKLRELGMLEHDDELGGEWVHDWDLLNPSPKADRTNAERQARYRERRNAVTGGVTNADVTPPEVKKGEEETPKAPQGGPAVRFNRKAVSAENLATATGLLDAFNERARTAYKPLDATGGPTEALKRIFGAVIGHGVDLDTGRRVIAHAFEHAWWSAEDTLHPGMVFGPNVIERNVQAVTAQPLQLSVHATAAAWAAADQESA